MSKKSRQRSSNGDAQSPATERPSKKQKRDDYRAALKEKNVDAETAALPQKRHFRQRAHANPFSDHNLVYPVNPEALNRDELFPAYAGSSKPIEVADIGCGFGGLLFALGPQFPDMLMMGMEIRTSVTEFVQEKIRALRLQPPPSAPSDPNTTTTNTTTPPYTYQNLACLRANTMKFLPNFFPRSSLQKLFLCFPDPHFKQRKHKARIVSATLTAEYAFVMKPGGIIYTITDVKDLHEWMRDHFRACPLFAELTEEELKKDVCVGIMSEATEESKKVTRNGGSKFVACFRRLVDPPWPGEGEVEGEGEGDSVDVVDLYA